MPRRYHGRQWRGLDGVVIELNTYEDSKADSEIGDFRSRVPQLDPHGST